MRQLKVTSLDANQIVDKVTHRQRILNVLTEPLTNHEISYLCGLDYKQVQKRTSDMEKDLVLFDCGTKDNHTIYFNVHPDGLETIKLNKEDKHKAKYIKRIKGLLKEFSDFLPADLECRINEELNK